MRADRIKPQCHIPVMVLLWPTVRRIEAHVSPAWSFLVIVTMMAVAVLAVSALTYAFFEKPINDYGRLIARKMAGAPTGNMALKPAE